MSSNQDRQGLPPKPAKQSAFERQKAEAEAKRKREAAETAAVYEDFVKSFDRDDDDILPSRRGDLPQGRGGGGGRPSLGPPSGGPSKRHFGATSNMKSGPGSLGPAPSGLGTKRSFQAFNSARGGNDRGNNESRSTAAKAFAGSDDEDERDEGNNATSKEDERAMAKPTLRLTNLPPGTSPGAVSALMPANMTVEDVKILPAAPGGMERRSVVAIVTMSLETPANEMDAAVSLLQNRYMGYGHHLSLHRHLSSAVSTSSAALPSFSSASGSSQPFGAKLVEQSSNANTQRFHKGFAPPTSYDAGPGVSRANLMHVPVKAPQDVRTLQLINMVIEGVLEHGPEFEALLMGRPEVQRDEKWAWLWDARSEGGIWLRYRLWQVVTGSQSKGKYVPLFDGGAAWKTPDKALPFEYATTLDELLDDPDYNSSDDDDDVDTTNNADESDEKRFLNPLDKAKLTHLLARMPVSISRLRKGDIARVTAFAMMHSSRGADEVVDLMTINVEQPLSLTRANPDKPGEDADTSAASLVALYAVNDVLSSSATSGVRHAWRYRQLFEAALQRRRTFEKLGLMPETLQWGRMRADKWKRSVGLVLNLWEGWCVFPAESQTLFSSTFENPPSSKQDETKPKVDAELSSRGKWKTVEATTTVLVADTAAVDAQGEQMDDDDVEGEPIDDDDIEGEPIDDDDIEGEPIDDDDIAGEAVDEDEVMADGEPTLSVAAPADSAAASQGPGPGRQRMRAVDMFADSDGE